MGELNRHPEGFSTLLKLLPEGYCDEPLDAYTRIEYASRALEELPYLTPYSEEIAGLIKQAAERFIGETGASPTRCYIGTEEWTALREYHAKNNLELHPSPEKDAYPIFEGMQLYMVNQPRHLFVA
jgi:hypothetical protein